MMTQARFVLPGKTKEPGLPGFHRMIARRPVA
jgi:hypothetical protein